jgi:hypothetical protein
MKIDFSIELSKKCITDTICCRKSSKIIPRNNIGDIHRVYEQTVYKPHIGKSHKGGGSCMLCSLFSSILCCVLAPVCGLFIGPILYWIKLADGTYTVSDSPSFMPTVLPTYHNNSHIII